MKKILAACLAASLLCGTAWAMDSQIKTLRVAMPAEPMAAELINDVLAQIEANAVAESADIRAQEEKAIAQGAAITDYYYGSRTELLYQSEHYTSFVVNFEQYTGGAHGYYGTIGYVFDNHTGEPLQITDLPGYGDPAFVERSVREFFAGRQAEIWPDSLTEALHGGHVGNFYINSDGYPVVVFNPYEIGPYVIGRMEAILPLQVE